MNGIPEPISFGFGLSSTPGRKTIQEPRIKLFKKINKSVLSHITFFLEADDHKPVDFDNKLLGFTCQLIRTNKKEPKHDST